MTEPTDLDRENAARRNAIALRFRKEYLEALGYAMSLFGPGWEPHGKHSLVTHEEAARVRYTGERATPAAVVITARKERDERHFIVENGTARECGPYAEALKHMLDERHPTRRVTVRGEEVPISMYEVQWSGFEPDYRPQSADQLAAAREKREAKALEREAQAHPLFADVIRAEGKPGRRR